ncbi:MAG: lipopolysaccharide kinase InaA family protein, partial [Omnitrophica WOR_2 bacterium]
MTNLAVTHALFRAGAPDFSDLPWGTPLSDWADICSRLEEVQRGPSRHPVVFVNYNGELFALKELPNGLAEKEYQLLAQLEKAGIPAVAPMGHLTARHEENEDVSILITRYLDRSLPYWSLFQRSGLDRYQEHLLDAMAELLVRLHLGGIYWGDCSLSNTLFRRDAGALQAYLVDAETGEIHPPRL